MIGYTWLALSAMILLFAYVAIWARRETYARYLGVYLAAPAAFASWIALQQPLGMPTDRQPEGIYEMVGIVADKDYAYVLLAGAGEDGQPLHVRLKLEDEKKDELLSKFAIGGDGRTFLDFVGGGEEPSIVDDLPPKADAPDAP